MMIGVYAPDGENDTPKYLRFLRKRTGVTDNKKIKNFTLDEFEKLWKAIELMEGSHTGKITEYTEMLKITGIKRDKKKTIIAYFIQSIGWVSKAEGINLTRQGKVDAVVAHSRSGNLYLRTKPDKSVADNLDAMG